MQLQRQQLLRAAKQGKHLVHKARVGEGETQEITTETPLHSSDLLDFSAVISCASECTLVPQSVIRVRVCVCAYAHEFFWCCCSSFP